MSAAVVSHFPSSSSASNQFDIQYHNNNKNNMTTSPPQSTPKPHNKPQRTRNNHNHNNNQHNSTHHQYAASDSNLPTQAQTPRPKKHRPRQTDHRAASGSDIPKVNRSKPVPVNKSPTLATPAKAAYAGPTFHASPAASALPMPKFVSKSVPPAASENSLQAKLESESTKANISSPAAEAAAPAAPLAREKSPLDIFFNADRQERAKVSSPLLQRRLTPPDSKGLFSMEMDAANSPRFTRSPAPAPAPAPLSTPQSEVIGTPNHQDEADNQAYTQSLKNFLNLRQQPPPNSSPAQIHHQPTHESYTTPRQQRTMEQDPSLLYGNRNLSPLFQAARNQSPYSTPQRDSPSQNRQSFDPRAYIDSQASQQSPFVTRQQYPPVHHQQQHYPTNGYEDQGGVSINGGHPPPPPPQHAHQQPPDCSPNVKDMEAKLRGMLKLC